jgi:hypothetical protein
MKRVAKVLNAKSVDMGGVKVLQPLPQHAQNDLDPFLLIHHWKETFPGGQKPSDLGVPPHPHKGFSPVTFIYNGSLRHQDSLGNDSIVHAGGTQWMFSDNGIIHSERPDTTLAEKGGEFELIQFWVNSPGRHKFDDPRYVPLQEEDTPKWHSQDEKVEVGVVSGSFKNVDGPIHPHSPMLLLRINSKENGELEFDLPSHFSAGLYLLNGKAEVNGTQVESQQMLVFEGDERKIQMKFNKESRMLFLSGEPLNEKVTSYGPFVMNTNREIMNALEEAQSGKFGDLKESFN